MESVEVVDADGKRLLMVACSWTEVGVLCGWIGTSDAPDDADAAKTLYDQHRCIKYRGRLSGLAE
jgi:hypothetical protein